MRHVPLANVVAAAVVVVVVVAAACGDDSVKPAAVAANQEPVAVLTLPSSAQAQVAVVVDAAGSFDVDGALVSASLTWGDDSSADDVADVAADVAADATSLSFEHTYASAGLYDVELAVTDDGGLTGRARMRLVVDAAPDANAPVVTSIELTDADGDGEVLDDGARVAAGATLGVVVHATDAEGNLASIDVVAGAATPASITVVGADASGTGAITLDANDVGDVVVSATAADAFGNTSAPLTASVHVISPDDDTDGDGLHDVDDPNPLVFNGLTAELFTLDGGIPTDLLGNQRAEKLVDELDEATPVTTLIATDGYLAMDSSTTSIATIYEGAPDTSTNFAVRYTGVLFAPQNADHLVVDVAADDIGVVALNGTVVASADDEYATDFLRFTKIPPTSDPISVPPDRKIPVVIVVANGDNSYAWSVRFRFFSGDTTVMNPEAVSQQQFEVSP